MFKQAMQIAAKKALKKALHFIVGAFFIACVTVKPAMAAVCSLQGEAETVFWDYVVDGDTVWLKDGRKIRLASINAPEISHDDKPAEPYGNQSLQILKDLLSKHLKIQLQVTETGKDHYGRTLAHLFLADGRSINATLLEKGLAFQAFSEDKNPYQVCLKSVERQARDAKVGVWSGVKIRDIRADRLKSGFQLLQGSVSRVTIPKKSEFVWVEMDGSVVLRIPKEGLDSRWLETLKGQRIEFRGWLVDRHKKEKQSKRFKRWMMGVYNKGAITVL